VAPVKGSLSLIKLRERHDGLTWAFSPSGTYVLKVHSGSVTSIKSQIAELRGRLEPFSSDCYIAPEGCEAHCYNVKRPSGAYRYNKLASNRAIFEPERQSAKVKVIHLSHDDPRNPEGRMGVERRNRSALDAQAKYPDDRPPVSIILCRTKDTLIADYALRDLNKPIGISTYRLGDLPSDLRAELPTVEQLQHVLDLSD